MRVVVGVVLAVGGLVLVFGGRLVGASPSMSRPSAARTQYNKLLAIPVGIALVAAGALYATGAI
jgi:hypothetical protein